MDTKLERLIHLFRSVASRADEMPGRFGLAGYAAVGRLFNDYVRQTRGLVGAEFVGDLGELEIPAGEADAAAFLGELAIRAHQIAEELDLMLDAQQAKEELEDDWEDAADALVRLKEAGVDVDDLVSNITAATGATSRLSRRRVDQVCRLAEAGVDVDDLVGSIHFWHGTPRGSRRNRRAGRAGSRRRVHRAGPHSVTIEYRDRDVRGGRQIVVDRNRYAEQDESQIAHTESSAADGPDRTWRMDILSRVEKGEMAPEDAAKLLRGQRTAQAAKDEETGEGAT